MKSLVKVTSMLLIASVSASAAAQDNAAPDAAEVPSHVPEWAGPEASDRLSADFNELVTLAALMVDSEPFDNAWTSFVKNHYEPGMPIERITDDVIDQAAEFRRQFRFQGRVMQAPMSRAEIRSKMLELAKPVIGEESR